MHNAAKLWLLKILPHHTLSRIIFFLTRLHSPVCRPFIRWFIRRYRVDMREAAQENIHAYTSFNAFFTRALKPGLRNFAAQAAALTCPVDGCISQIGVIKAQSLLQAKGHHYRLEELLAGDMNSCQIFAAGGFTTLYLSPRDYHRIHMPCNGKLLSMRYVPGRLFSVAPYTVEKLPRLFARNERVICYFDTPLGKLAVILVGAINVAAIETVWHGLVTPGQKRAITSFDYREKNITLDKGNELGRFNMGSTVILLTEKAPQWEINLCPGSSVKLGQLLGTIA